MVIEEINEGLNVGIPIYRSVPLVTSNVNLYCSNRISNTTEAHFALNKKYSDKIKELIGVENRKQSMNITTKLDVLTNAVDSKAFLGLNDIRKIRNLLEELVEKELPNSSLEKLKEERNFAHFKDQFGSVIDPLSIEELMEKYKKLLNIFNNRTGYLELEGKFETVIDYYKNQSKYLSGIYQNIDTIIKIDSTKELNDYLNTLDIERTIFYIALKYLNYMEYFLERGERALAIELSFLVDGFLKNHNNKNIKIKIIGGWLGYDDIKIKYYTLRKQYKLPTIEFSRRLFSLKTYDENKDIINNIINLENIKTRKEIIGDELFNFPKMTNSSNVNRPRHIMTELEEIKLDNYIENKHYVYFKNNPIAKIDGTGNLNKYSVYVYENGLMPADRFKYTNITQIDSDRAYVFNVDNFEEYIGSSKTELRLSGEVKAMNHTETFNDRIGKLLSLPSTDESKEKVKTIVKKYENK